MAEELELRDYLYALRVYLIFVCILFGCAVAFGYLGFLSEVFSESLAWLEQLSEGIADFTEIYSPLLIFIAFFIVIFLNNAYVLPQHYHRTAYRHFPPIFRGNQWRATRLAST